MRCCGVDKGKDVSDEVTGTDFACEIDIDILDCNLKFRSLKLRIVFDMLKANFAFPASIRCN